MHHPSKRRQRRKPMSEINVVPYIDVMLVLLVIFMVTAPLLTQGVKVDLPQANANPILPTEDLEPLVVSVDIEGNFYVNFGDNKDQPVDPDTLLARVAGLIRVNPKVPVVVKGDKNVPYGSMVDLMVLLQKAGAPSVGLMTDAPEEPQG
jgi:biopolymer transport protein TolR